jgi:hypothetical protein
LPRLRDKELKAKSVANDETDKISRYIKLKPVRIIFIRRF